MATREFIVTLRRERVEYVSATVEAESFEQATYLAERGEYDEGDVLDDYVDAEEVSEVECGECGAGESFCECYSGQEEKTEAELTDMNPDYKADGSIPARELIHGTWVVPADDYTREYFSVSEDEVEPMKVRYVSSELDSDGERTLACFDQQDYCLTYYVSDACCFRVLSGDEAEECNNKRAQARMERVERRKRDEMLNQLLA